MEASLFMLNYLYLAKAPRMEVDIDAVIAAHDQYVHCHAAIRDGRVDLDNFLDIDDAWVVTRDYRALEVMMRSCNGCHIQFVSSIHDNRQCCPICNGAVVRSDVFACDAQVAVTDRSVAELIELASPVLKFKHWGATQTEICKELRLNNDEYLLCEGLSKITKSQLAILTQRYSKGVELLGAFKQDGLNALKVSPAALAVA